MIDAAVWFVTGALSVVVGRFVLTRWLGRTSTETAHKPAQRFVCDGCGKPYTTEAEAINHAKVEHDAPDDESAAFIITEDYGTAKVASTPEADPR